MRPTVQLPVVEVSRWDAVPLWVAGVLLFGVGDVLTTVLGLGHPGVTEGHPLAAYLFEFSTVGAVVLLKGIALVTCYGLWKVAPHPARLGVPVGLALCGAGATAWNLHLLVVLWG